MDDEFERHQPQLCYYVKMLSEVNDLRSRWSQVNSQPGSFGERLAIIRGDTPESEFQRNLEQFRREQGCVIRSLEHAVGATATDEECLMRAVQIEGIGNAIVRYITRKDDGYEGDFTQFYKEETDIEWQKILELIRTIGTRDSPLGNAIAAHLVEGHRNVTTDQIQFWMNEGRIVLLCEALMYPSPSRPGKNEIGRHMAHIQIAEDGNFIFLSDNGTQMMKPDKDDMLDVITLSPKI
jgi:hypothetical protein